MNLYQEFRSFPILKIRHLWATYCTQTMTAGIGLMILATIYRLQLGYSRLLWESGWNGAIDLKIFHWMVNQWFAGFPVYGTTPSPVDFPPFVPDYPPASYVLLWPFHGWLNVQQIRWVWAVITVVSFVSFAYLAIQASGAQTIPERLFISLLFPSMYAVSSAVAVGQLVIPLLPTLVAGISLLHLKHRRWYEEFIGVILILVTLAKPTISAPFFWLVLFGPRMFRPALLASLGYITLTVFAAHFQKSDPILLLVEWVKYASIAVEFDSVTSGYGNIHTWLTILGFDEFNIVMSLFILLALGFWVYRYQSIDIWFHIGIIAIVARFWTYHQIYDDLLILLSIITLFRTAKKAGVSSDLQSIIPGVLLIITSGAILAPASMLDFPAPWNIAFKAGQVIVWCVVLIFLLAQAQMEYVIQKTKFLD